MDRGSQGFLTFELHLLESGISGRYFVVFPLFFASLNSTYWNLVFQVFLISLGIAHLLCLNSTYWNLVFQGKAWTETGRETMFELHLLESGISGIEPTNYSSYGTYV